MERFSEEKNLMKKYHNVSNIRFENDTLVMTIDGNVGRFALAEVSPVLETATKSQRQKYEISPSGYGISWPELDEDLSIDALQGIRHQRARKKQNNIVKT